MVWGAGMAEIKPIEPERVMPSRETNEECISAILKGTYSTICKKILTYATTWIVFALLNCFISL